jgi:hypothetical protein
VQSTAQIPVYLPLSTRQPLGIFLRYDTCEPILITRQIDLGAVGCRKAVHGFMSAGLYLTPLCPKSTSCGYGHPLDGVAMSASYFSQHARSPIPPIHATKVPEGDVEASGQRAESRIMGRQPGQSRPARSSSCLSGMCLHTKNTYNLV